jgi:dihydrofolate synthase/folylpolyglutamate synthase
MPPWPPVPVAPLPGDPLGRTRALLDRLGNPERRLPPVVHVAGTNGKGSTIAFLRAMAEAAGLRVHAYTSPHLIRFNERIRLAGEEIGDDTLQLTLEETRIRAGDLPVNVFEGTTAAALLAFSRVPADLMLVECGMGGRFDATNVIPDIRLSLLASISHDHMEYLGHELKQIAWHKAGILRPQVPAIVTYQPPEALAEIVTGAQAAGAPLYRYGTHWAVQKTAVGFRYVDENGPAELPRPALLGDHQLLNAGNAIAAVSLLTEFDIRAEHVLHGLASVQWPGRLERIRHGALAAALPPGFELWYDGGHNAGGAQAISGTLREWRREGPVYLIVGTTRGKDLPALLSPLAGFAQATFGVRVQAEANCYAAREIAQAASAAAHPDVHEAETVAEALAWLKENRPPGRVLVFGSLFFRIELVA